MATEKKKIPEHYFSLHATAICHSEGFLLQFARKLRAEGFA